jgi:hypothetical protein
LLLKVSACEVPRALSVKSTAAPPPTLPALLPLAAFCVLEVDGRARSADAAAEARSALVALTKEKDGFCALDGCGGGGLAVSA